MMEEEKTKILFPLWTQIPSLHLLGSATDIVRAVLSGTHELLLGVEPRPLTNRVSVLPLHYRMCTAQDGVAQPASPPAPEEHWAGLECSSIWLCQNLTITWGTRWKSSSWSTPPGAGTASPWWLTTPSRPSSWQRRVWATCWPRTVDATVESKLGKRFGDRGFLSIKLFRKGQEVEDYKGGRTKGDIVKYIRQEAGQVKDELWSVWITW